MSTIEHDESSTLDPREARAILDTTQHEARSQIDVRSDLLFLVWGVAWLVGYLSMWWSTRAQDPYTGPPAWAGVVLATGIVLAAGATVVVIARAVSGLSGASSRTGTFYGLTWAVGFLTWQSLMGALADQGVSDEVGGILGAAMPALIVAIIYCASSAVWDEPALFVVGVWLAVAAGVGVWTGPSTVSLVIGSVGGLGFLVGAALARRQRS